MKHGTQKLIAGRAKISEAFLSEIISTKKRPSWSTSKRLCQAVPGTFPELWLEGSPSEIRAAIGAAEIKTRPEIMPDAA